LFQRAETALLGEKANKLFGIARYLDKSLGSGYASLLKSGGGENNLSRETKLEALNKILSPLVDSVCESFPGLGAGYYSRELDCIIVYGPTVDFGDKSGFRVRPDHVGRRCMATRRPITNVGSMVRGEIMNCVIPIIRNDEVEGYIWANETVEDIYKQMNHGGMKTFLSADIEPLLGLTGLLMLAGHNLIDFQSKDINTFSKYIKLFLNSLQIGVVVADSTGTVCFCSNRMSVFGVNPKNFEGEHVNFLFKAVGFGKWQEMEAELKQSYELQFSKLRTGYPLDEMNVVMAALTGSNSEWLGFVTLFEDMTAAQREEEGIQRTEAVHTIEQLAVTMAHEISNPLTILRESIKMIPNRMDNKDYFLKFVGVALSEIERVEKVTRSLSELSRFSKPELIEFDVIRIIDRAVELTGQMAEMQGVRIVKQYESSDSIILGDTEHLYQAILNLLINALQAMPDGGELHVRVMGDSHSKFIYIQISDTGRGVAPEIESKMFEPFYTTKKNGTGLGLALVQSIVSKHNGILSFEPGAGAGAVFTIGLPKQQIIKNMLGGIE
jgi:two-component system sensor histidine kinase AtoS